jgi:hypothetical protein
MAHDAFHELQVRNHALAGAGGWEHDAPMSSLLGPHEAVLMEKLVASRLGVSSVPSSRYASCYRTPLGHPFSNPVAAPVNAARLSCFADELSRVASSQSLLAEQTPSPCRGVTPHASDGSTSDDRPSRKRKKAASVGGKSKANKEATITTTAKVLTNRLSFRHSTTNAKPTARISTRY